jgi:putative DNA primase/helicase
MSTATEFLAVLVASGLGPVREVDFAEGKLHRYRGPGDKPGKLNCWAVFHSHPVPCGAYGSWRTGEVHHWRIQRDQPLTAAQRADLQRQMRAIQQARSEEQQRVQASARDRAAQLLRVSRPATNAHPYLLRKGIPAYGIRQLRDMLVVPGRDAQGVLHTLQFIGPDGAKRFLTAGRVAGCYFAIGRPSAELLLAEGLATASSLFQATGSATAVCFNCANLEPVARALRAKFPRLRLVLCADDDRDTPGNPGLTHAKAAAKAVGGYLAVPRFEVEAE